MDHVFAVAPHARGWLIAHPVSKLARVRAALGGMIKPVQEGEDIEGREVLTAHARILAPLSPRERDSLLDLLIRVIQANAIYARPGAGRQKRGSRQSPANKV